MMDRRVADRRASGRRAGDELEAEPPKPDRVPFVVAIMVVVVVVLAGVGIVSVVLTQQQLAEINQRQIEAVQTQNAAQLCTQHEIIVAIRSVSRELGLPTDNIPIPDVGELPCEELLDAGGLGLPNGGP